MVVFTEAEAPDTRVPLTIITGFLGSGKTSLVQHILHTATPDRKIAVIQNEFADEMGIEAQVLTDANGKVVSDFYELGNGCVCCSVRDTLIGTLDALLEKDSSFTHILVETTGVADPERLAEVFWVDQGCGTNVYLDGIVTVVDCLNFADHLAGNTFEKVRGHLTEDENDKLSLSEEAEKQVACAHKILLNKTDICTPPKIDDTENLVRSINPEVPIVHSVRSKVDPSSILGIRALGPQAALACLATVTAAAVENREESICPSRDPHCTGKAGGAESCGHECTEKGHDHPHHHKAPAHHSVQHCIVKAGPIDMERFERWVGEVLWESESRIFRCKGVVVSGGGQVFSLQGVGDLFEIEPVQIEDESFSVSESKVMFIGKTINRADIERGLKSCENSYC